MIHKKEERASMVRFCSYLLQSELCLNFHSDSTEATWAEDSQAVESLACFSVWIFTYTCARLFMLLLYEPAMAIMYTK